jgi:hypothetical protein
MRMGPYTESHAHQDQLSLLLYDDRWLAYDANSDSHSGIEQGEENHNLVRVERGGDVVPQREGHSSSVIALADNDEFTYAAADATPVYDGGLDLAQRELVYVKPGVFVVYDRIDGGAGTKYVWQLNSPLQPTVTSSGASFGGTGDLRVNFVKPAAAANSVVSPTTDLNKGYRLERSVSTNDGARFLNVLSVDSSVASVAAADTASSDGVTVTLAGGGTATVRFNRNAPGGTLALSGAAGSFNGALPSGVSVPPVLAP